MSSILSGLIFGSIGLWMVRESRRRANTYFMLIGIALMVYPYFSKNVWTDWGIGIGLCYLAYELRNS
ncbi:hypothetical protein K2X30_12515 [bacterium]|nr:hypothetical protein [bacterium]